MDFVFDLLNLIIQVTLFGGVIYAIIYGLRSKKLNSTKNDLQNLQARLSQLRLALKAKMRRKANILRSMSKAPIVEGDLFDTSLKNLCEVKFEVSADFQQYFDISKQILKIIVLEGKGEGLAPHTAENNFMSNDFKTEIDIIRMIKEMSDLSARLNSKIEEHNRTNSQKIQKIENIVFPAMVEVNRIFKSDESIEKTSDTKLESSKAS